MKSQRSIIRICSAPKKNIIMRYTKIILSPHRDRTQGRPSVLKLVSRSFCVQQSDFHFLVAVCEASSEVRVAERRRASRCTSRERRGTSSKRGRASPKVAERRLMSPNVLSRRRTSTRVTRVASIVITCRRSSRVPCHVSGPLSAILYERCNASGSLMRSYINAIT